MFERILIYPGSPPPVRGWLDFYGRSRRDVDIRIEEVNACLTELSDILERPIYIARYPKVQRLNLRLERAPDSVFTMLTITQIAMLRRIPRVATAVNQSFDDLVTWVDSLTQRRLSTLTRTGGRTLTTLMIQQYGFFQDRFQDKPDLSPLVVRALREVIQTNPLIAPVLRRDLFTVPGSRA